MSEGSHMIGGRTYRNVITTNEQKPTGPLEPQKLKIITTAIIPDAPKVAPPIVGTDLSKMITTHDEPKKDAADILYESDMDYAVKAAQRVDEDFKADTKETPLAKKPGRPKKEK